MKTLANVYRNNVELLAHINATTKASEYDDFVIAAVPQLVYKQLATVDPLKRGRVIAIAELEIPVGAYIYVRELKRVIDVTDDNDYHERGIVQDGMVYWFNRIRSLDSYRVLASDLDEVLTGIEGRKMRCSQVVCKSINVIDAASIGAHLSEDGSTAITADVMHQLQSHPSNWDIHFEYLVGKTIVPEHGFSLSSMQCVSGIHFFYNMGDAIAYSL